MEQKLKEILQETCSVLTESRLKLNAKQMKTAIIGKEGTVDYSLDIKNTERASTWFRVKLTIWKEDWSATKSTDDILFEVGNDAKNKKEFQRFINEINTLKKTS